MNRVITSVVLALFAVYSIFWAPAWLFTLIVVGMACLCYHEFIGIAQAAGVQGPFAVGYATGLAVLARPDAIPLAVLVLMAVALFSREMSRVPGFVGTTVLALVYIFAAWRWAVELRGFSPWWLLFALSINWAGDVAAYYVGRAIGKHKLAPLVSPGKSWEGAAASMVASIAYGFAFRQLTHLAISPPGMLALAALANVAGQVGDLAESAFKRGAGVKDSGTLLPGHGGILDRLDSSLFTLPVVHYFLLWVVRPALTSI